ncbi:MAG: BatA and WFA domain-containing protein [Saprospiraceae bacterium]|nr:BatA and WFA domain-containing protein [Saprospiraceae bacterium]
MSFLYPSFLWAIAGLSIPIIIHLFYFRRFKKVYFSNTKFLQEIKEETSSRSRLKNLLVLLMRCLALAALVFAFAQPFLKKDDKVRVGEKAISIFVDNSFSMNGERQNIPLIDIAKERARDIVNAYTESDKFQILTQDFDGKYQRTLTKDDALTTIDQITPSPAVHQLTQVINRQKQVLKGENQISYLISDFQKSITNLVGLQDTTMEVNLIPIQGINSRNVSIDSVWFVSPVPMINQNNALVVRLHNYGDDDVESVKLSILKDGQERPIGLMDVAAGSSATDTINLSIATTGTHQAEIKILDYPIQFDDSYFISFEVAEKINILSIDEGGANRYLDALFKGISYFQINHQNLSQIQYQEFDNNQLIILHDLRTISSGLASELLQYIKAGGKVLVFPGANADINSYNQFLSMSGANTLVSALNDSKEVANINTGEFLFSDVFENNNRNLKLPTVNLSYLISTVSSIQPSENIMSFRDGNAFINKYRVEEGILYLCASPLDETKNDLVRQAEIFVPMTYRMAISRTNPEIISYKIGGDKFVEMENKAGAGGDITYKITGKKEFIPGQRNLGKKMILDVSNQIVEGGLYDAVLNDQKVKTLAFNFDRAESDLSFYSNSELADQIKTNPAMTVISQEQQAGINVAISEKDQGIVLWRWFLWAAIAFLLVEALLIRFLKT